MTAVALKKLIEERNQAFSRAIDEQVKRSLYLPYLTFITDFSEHVQKDKIPSSS
jgi:hypothetical protein